MNEFSKIEGGKTELPAPQQVLSPAAYRTSDAAVVLFRDMMRRESAGDSGQPQLARPLAGLGANDARQSPDAGPSGLAIDGLDAALLRAPTNVRTPAGEGEGDTSAPFNIPAELMAGGVPRGTGHPPASVHEASAQAGAAQADAAHNDAVASLLQHFCANLYVAESQKPGMGHIMVDLGAALPGSSVEMTRDGVFLNVRLHAADDTMLRRMRGGSARLLDALNKSTGLVVRLDLVQRADSGAGQS
jgi:hypothetical protein